MADEITITFSRDELEMVRDGLVYMTTYYAQPPDPPTPSMTAREKVEKKLEAA